MQLAELTVRGFADLLGSDAPAPGGGSAAALAGALGAALTAMVGSLTVGRKKYAEFDGLARETLEKARDLEHRFLDVMERDTEAFNAVSAVFAMPKGTDQEKEARAAAMQEALQGCTKTPFEMMELSLEALRLTDGLVDRSNASAASDLGCAALHLGSAVQGAWLNVLINLGSVRDAAFAGDFMAMIGWDRAREALSGRRFERGDVRAALEGLPLREMFGGITLGEILTLMFGEDAEDEGL